MMTDSELCGNGWNYLELNAARGMVMTSVFSPSSRQSEAYIVQVCLIPELNPDVVLLVPTLPVTVYVPFV